MFYPFVCLDLITPTKIRQSSRRTYFKTITTSSNKKKTFSCKWGVLVNNTSLKTSPFTQWCDRSVMPCAKIFLFFLFQITFVFSTVEAATFSRSLYFTTRENKQLVGYVVKRFDSLSLLSCGQQCMRNAWCTSTNYKMSSKKDGKGTCELNKHDIPIINENTNFHDQHGVTFSTLLKVM